METNRTKSILWMVMGAVIALVAAIVYVIALTYKPAYGSTYSGQQAVALGTSPSGQKTATIHLNIQPVVGSPVLTSGSPSPLGPHPDWLGYQTPDGKAAGTVFHVPPNALVTVIVHNFDSRTIPRNPFFSLVQGTQGGVEYVGGKPIKLMDPSLMSHTFTIADLGVSVPMEGIPSNSKPNTYETMKFTFRTTNGGVFRWQCIVPCGSGLYGFGGPMQEVGYMDGIFNVG